MKLHAFCPRSTHPPPSNLPNHDLTLVYSEIDYYCYDGIFSTRHIGDKGEKKKKTL